MLLDDSLPISPDCVVGKGRACAGFALDESTDEVVDCACTCHEGPCSATVIAATRIDEAERCDEARVCGTELCPSHVDDEP